MATRSTIAIELEDGKVKQVYCHWDGYLDNNGQILLNNYDRNKTEQLIALGDISSLEEEVGEKHSFDERGVGTTFYGRDRGEEDTGYKLFHDFDHYRNDHQYEEYEYILRKDDKWYVAMYGDRYVPLADAIADEMIEKELAED